MVNSWLFELWREYFDVRYVTEFEDAPIPFLNEGSSHVTERTGEDNVMETRNKTKQDGSNEDEKTSMLPRRENNVIKTRSEKRKDDSKEDHKSYMLAQSEKNVLETSSDEEEASEQEEKTYMLAQMPHGVIVSPLFMLSLAISFE